MKRIKNIRIKNIKIQGLKIFTIQWLLKYIDPGIKKYIRSIKTKSIKIQGLNNIYDPANINFFSIQWIGKDQLIYYPFVVKKCL
jgi:hypothetical protein